MDAALDVDKVRNLSLVLARLCKEENIQILNITHKQDVIVGFHSVCDSKEQCNQIIGTYYLNNSTQIVSTVNE